MGARPREGSVRSRAPLEEQADGLAERDPKERRASMRTLETAPSILLPDGTDASADVAEDKEEEHEAPTHTPEDKGKSVDAAEHVGAAPTLAETAATFGLPIGGDILAPPSEPSDAASRDDEKKEGVETATEASTPRGEKDEGEALAVDGERKEEHA